MHGQPCDAGDSSFLPGGPTLREFTVMTHAPLTPPSTAFCKAQYHGGDSPVCQLPATLNHSVSRRRYTPPSRHSPLRSAMPTPTWAHSLNRLVWQNEVAFCDAQDHPQRHDERARHRDSRPRCARPTDFCTRSRLCSAPERRAQPLSAALTACQAPLPYALRHTPRSQSSLTGPTHNFDAPAPP